MSIGTSFRRVLSERRLFIPWTTAVFATVFTGTLAWLLDARGGLLIWIVLVSLGGGWLAAFYMWHVNDAAARAWEPWVSAKRDGDKDRDV